MCSRYAKQPNTGVLNCKSTEDPPPQLPRDRGNRRQQRRVRCTISPPPCAPMTLINGGCSVGKPPPSRPSVLDRLFYLFLLPAFSSRVLAAVLRAISCLHCPGCRSNESIPTHRAKPKVTLSLIVHFAASSSIILNRERRSNFWSSSLGFPSPSRSFYARWASLSTMFWGMQRFFATPRALTTQDCRSN